MAWGRSCLSLQPPEGVPWPFLPGETWDWTDQGGYTQNRLRDLDTPPFKEHFQRIPPPQVDEVREHLKLMLDAGAIRPSNSPWCNVVVLVRKKDSLLRFCIDFRRLNALTKKDSHPLPRICETLDSLVGSAYYSTFDLTSGFWQVPMDEESKQYTAFTLGSMGLYECERMPFRLCNAPATFQRLMQNCLCELNLTYYLIYLDDVIIYSKMPAEHLQRMRVTFDCLRMHGLKLKPSNHEPPHRGGNRQSWLSIR